MRVKTTAGDGQNIERFLWCGPKIKKVTLKWNHLMQWDYYTNCRHYKCLAQMVANSLFQSQFVIKRFSYCNGLAYQVNCALFTDHLSWELKKKKVAKFILFSRAGSKCRKESTKIFKIRAPKS